MYTRVLASAAAAVFVIACAPPTAGESNSHARPLTIVKASPSTWQTDYAANELARYAMELTGRKAIVTPQPPPDAGQVIYLAIGPTADCLRALPGGDDPARLRDGFAITTVAPGRLRIAAIEPIGLLYGVYDYLEEYCDVGFFWEGNYVPEIDCLPTDGINRLQIPRWPMREMLVWGTFGLAKYHDHYRSSAEREKIYDWMAKSRLNYARYDFMSDIAHSGKVAVDVFGIDDKTPDNFTYAGWPGVLDVPADVRTAQIREQFEYSRQRGIRWIYGTSIGDVPHQWRQMHPDYKYLPNLGYSATTLDPSDPRLEPLMHAFYNDIIKTYGTDHLYMCTPMCESMGADTPEAAYKVKVTAAKELLENLHAIDKNAIWQWDTWDFLAVPQVWTSERKRDYIQAFKGQPLIVYDTVGESSPQYKDSDYFSGAGWQFGILHSFQGDDHLHGNFADYLKRIQDLSRDPKADNCLGINLVPETTGHNLMFFDLVAKTAWDPEGTTLRGFLIDRAVHRYGRADAPRMYSALKSVVRAVYSGGGRTPIYKKLGCQYGPGEWWPIVGDRMKDTTPQPLYQDIADLREAIRLGLSCRESQKNNDLYVTDMVDWTRTYLAHIFNWEMIDAFKALQGGDSPRFAKSSAAARDCLKRIEDMMSTRPDFHLQPQIDRLMAVPGVNPYTAWYMKQHCVNDLYSANDVYEQMHWFYRPRVDAYLDKCAEQLAAGKRAIEWKDIEEKCNAIRSRWLDDDIRVPADQAYTGSALDAVASAYDAYGSLADQTYGEAGGSGGVGEASLRDLGNLK